MAKVLDQAALAAKATAEFEAERAKMAKTIYELNERLSRGFGDREKLASLEAEVGRLSASLQREIADHHRTREALASADKALAAYRSTARVDEDEDDEEEQESIEDILRRLFDRMREEWG